MVPREHEELNSGAAKALDSADPTRSPPADRCEDDVEANIARRMVRRALFGSATDDLAPTPGVENRLGRFEVIRLLGRGGMGVVYLARDPELERDLAVKIMLRVGDDSAARARRTRREALALAKLNHDNVVTVHEVGEHDGHVFVAMEYIEGRTLGEWMRSGPNGRARPWREVIRVFRAAGRGLAAAHGVGLVHRDFKPDNVMLGYDGRIRVMDFGLARAETEDAQSLDVTAPDASTSDESALPLTRTGALVGTPAYMSPEQFLGAQVTAASDQFSFCVALHEALYGVRPFGGKTVDALASSVVAGKRRPVSSKVPTWLERIVARGLAREAEDRYPSMSALLAELGAGEARRRRRQRLGAAVVLGVTSVGVFGVSRYDEMQREATCTAQGKIIDEIWNETSREALRAGLTAAAEDGGDTARRVVPWIDRQAQAWAEHTHSACMNATVHQTWTPTDLDKARWCLEDRRLELSSLIAGLTRADQEVAEDAVWLAASLSAPEVCVDETVLAVAIDPPGAALRPRVAELREQLARASYLQAAGKYEAGLELAHSVTTHCDALGWLPLTASARQREAELLDLVGDYPAAEATARAAYMDAARSDTWDIAVDAANRLVFILGCRGARLEEAVTWAEHASVAISHAGDPMGLREAERSNHLGAAYHAQGKYAEALEAQQRALELTLQALGPEHLQVATDLNNLGLVHESLGDYDEARACQRRALAIREQVLGPKHPKLATPLENLANLHTRRGDHAKAKPLYARAVELKEATLGRGHTSTASTYINYASAHRETGDYDEARRLYEEALTALVDTLGPEHSYVGAGLINLGLVDEAIGDYDAARRRYARALSIWEEAHGPEHPNVSNALNNLGHVHHAMGNHDEARALYERALEIRRRALPDGHPDHAESLTGLGAAMGALDSPAEALPYLERAVEIRSGEGIPPEELAASEYELALVLWSAPVDEGRDRPRARTLAEHAKSLLEPGNPSHGDLLTRLTAWLETTGDASPLAR